MDELLKALQSGDPERVSELAAALLLTRFNQVNYIEMNKFEHYAPCRIYPAGMTLWQIRYGDKVFLFKSEIRNNLLKGEK